MSDDAEPCELTKKKTPLRQTKEQLAECRQAFFWAQYFIGASLIEKVQWFGNNTNNGYQVGVAGANRLDGGCLVVVHRCPGQHPTVTLYLAKDVSEVYRKTQVTASTPKAEQRLKEQLGKALSYMSVEQNRSNPEDDHATDTRTDRHSQN